MVIARTVPIPAVVELRRTGPNGLPAVSHVVEVLEPVKNALLGHQTAPKIVTTKVKTAMKTIVLPGLPGNHGEVAQLNVKKVVVTIQQEPDTDVGIQKMVLANNVLAVRPQVALESNVEEMPLMFAIKNKKRAVTKISNVLLSVNGLSGVNGEIVLQHVKTVLESEDEQITKMTVLLATVLVLNLSDVRLLKLKSVLNA